MELITMETGVLPFLFVLSLCASLFFELAALAFSGLCYGLYHTASWLWQSVKCKKR